MNKWENIPEDISKYHGFIYKITNLQTGRKYIGKKSFFSTVNVAKPKTTKTKYELERLNKLYHDLEIAKKYRVGRRISKKEHIIKQKIIGFKLKIKERIRTKHHTKTKKVSESDWKNYYGSSKELLQDVEMLGKQLFRREIILLCLTKWEWSYNEARLIIKHKALYDKAYYNGVLQCKMPKAPKNIQFNSLKR